MAAEIERVQGHPLEAERLYEQAIRSASEQGKLVGVLYLENNLASGVFTPNRLAILELIASQAAISLEQARLYAELSQENRDRKQAQEALRASEERLQATPLRSFSSRIWNSDTVESLQMLTERSNIPGRLGFANMRARVKRLNGSLDIRPAPGRGTSIIVSVPVSGSGPAQSFA